MAETISVEKQERLARRYEKKNAAAAKATKKRYERLTKELGIRRLTVLVCDEDRAEAFRLLEPLMARAAEREFKAKLAARAAAKIAEAAQVAAPEEAKEAAPEPAPVVAVAPEAPAAPVPGPSPAVGFKPRWHKEDREPVTAATGGPLPNLHRPPAAPAAEEGHLAQLRQSGEEILTAPIGPPAGADLSGVKFHGRKEEVK